MILKPDGTLYTKKEIREIVKEAIKNVTKELFS